MIYALWSPLYMLHMDERISSNKRDCQQLRAKAKASQNYITWAGSSTGAKPLS